MNVRSTLIAFVATLTLMLALPQAVANGLIFLPELGNNELGDRALSRDVADDHVYTGDRNIPEVVEQRPLAVVREDTGVHAPDLTELSTGSLIWDSIRQSNAIPLNESESVTQFQQRYIEHAHYTNLMLERSRPYIAHLVKALHQRYLPVELSLLPAIESGYQPHGVSSNNAVGLWQIVPITAREIGILRTPWYDGRADVVTSTTAAIDYLSYLNAEFEGDWEHTLAAYNAGPGRLRRAIKSNEEAGKPTHFSALDLPQETRNYVPKFIALVGLVKDAEQTIIELPLVDTDDAFKRYELPTRVSLDRLATLTNIPHETLKNLNPGLIHGITPPDGPHTVYLPKERASEFETLIASAVPENLFTVPISHTVASGETLGEIALRYDMSMQQLQSINHLDSDRIRIGQKLSVVDSRFLEQPKLIQYVVSSGDTLSDIAAQYSVNVSEIVTVAGEPLASDVIKPGDTLQIRVPAPNGG